MTGMPEPWQLYPMPPEQVAKIQAYIASRISKDQAAADEKDRLLSTARRFLDEIAAGDRPQTQQQREWVEKLAQRIVDEIGHSVTDEPALGPDMRAQLAQIGALADRWDEEVDGSDVEDFIARLRPILEAEETR